MANLVLGRELGTAICEALGLDPRKVSKITIVSNADDIATVTIVQAIEEDEVGKLKQVIAKYTLADKEETVGEPVADASGIVADVNMGSPDVKKFRA